MDEQPREHRETDDLDHAVRDLAKIGRLWAQHGLGVGQSALETSAATLRATAGLLGRLAEGLAAEAEKPKEREAEEQPAPPPAEGG